MYRVQVESILYTEYIERDELSWALSVTECNTVLSLSSLPIPHHNSYGWLILHLLLYLVALIASLAVVNDAGSCVIQCYI